MLRFRQPVVVVEQACAWRVPSLDRCPQRESSDRHTRDVNTGSPLRRCLRGVSSAQRLHVIARFCWCRAPTPTWIASGRHDAVLPLAQRLGAAQSFAASVAFQRVCARPGRSWKLVVVACGTASSSIGRKSLRGGISRIVSSSVTTLVRAIRSGLRARRRVTPLLLGPCEPCDSPAHRVGQRPHVREAMNGSAAGRRLRRDARSSRRRGSRRIWGVRSP